MDHAATTKINDAITNRQFNRFLATAHLPSIWKGRVKVLANVYEEIFARGRKRGAEVNRVYLCIQPRETP